MTLDLSHSELSNEAAKWLRKKGCAVVITDMSHAGSETPDAIGWQGKFSTVIECKTSRSDFYADAKKSFRLNPSAGMGCFRYFCAKKGLLNPDALPLGWGLLEWNGKKLTTARKSERFTSAAAREEVSLLLSAMRRIGSTSPKGVSVKCYSMESKNRATLGILAELPV